MRNISVSLPQAANGRFAAVISEPRAPASGRLLSDCLLRSRHSARLLAKSTENADRVVHADRLQPAMTGVIGGRSSRWLGTHRHCAAWSDLAGCQKYGRNVWREVNHAIGAGTHYHDPIR